MNIKIILGITLALFLSSPVYSNFDLFDSDRGKIEPVPVKPKPVTTAFTSSSKNSKTPPPIPFMQSRKSAVRKQLPPKKLPPQKDFELRGTSIIGSFRAAVLKGPDGKEKIYRFKDKKPTPAGNEGIRIKENANGYDYYLLKVEPRQIQIEYPKESPCRDSNDQKGLKCAENQKTAMLELKSLKALPQQAQPKPKTKAKTNQAKKRDNANDKRKQLYRNFKRRVIKDEEVPPGMRVVRTPFGDRLVPDNKK